MKFSVSKFFSKVGHFKHVRSTLKSPNIKKFPTERKIKPLPFSPGESSRKREKRSKSEESNAPGRGWRGLKEKLGSIESAEGKLQRRHSGGVREASQAESRWPRSGLNPERARPSETSLAPFLFPPERNFLLPLSRIRRLSFFSV